MLTVKRARMNRNAKMTMPRGRQSAKARPPPMCGSSAIRGAGVHRSSIRVLATAGRALLNVPNGFRLKVSCGPYADWKEAAMSVGCRRMHTTSIGPIEILLARVYPLFNFSPPLPLVPVMKKLSLLLAIQLAVVASEAAKGKGHPAGKHSGAAKCAEDPLHTIGEEWECDDKCNTCHCTPDGHVKATGLCCGDDCGPKTELFESTVVHMALAVALFCVAALGVLCFFMCCKGGNKKAAELVRELDDAENA